MKYCAYKIMPILYMEHWWNGTDRKKSKYLGKNLPQCHKIQTNPVWIGLVLKHHLHTNFYPQGKDIKVVTQLRG
jgi:hypothetical protein